MKKISLKSLAQVSIFILGCVLWISLVLFFSNTEASDKSLLYFKDEIKITNDNIKTNEATKQELQKQIEQLDISISTDKKYIDCLLNQVTRIAQWEEVESNYCEQGLTQSRS